MSTGRDIWSATIILAGITTIILAGRPGMIVVRPAILLDAVQRGFSAPDLLARVTPANAHDPRAIDQRGTPMSYRDRITIEPGKRGGRPCVRSMRITVYDVLGWLASGMTEQEILRDFPELEPEDIRACLEFAADREHHLISVRGA